MTPDEQKQDTAARQSQSKIGLSVSYEGRTVSAVMTGSLAEQAGIKVGDIVYAMNGAPVQEMDISTFFAQLFGGSRVSLALKRAGTQNVQVTINHNYIDPTDVPHGRRLAGNVGYIAVPGITMPPFYDEYADIGQQIIREIDQGGTPTCGWVVDLQLNYGGSSSPMLAEVGPVLGEGKAYQSIYPNGDRWTSYYQDGGVVVEGPQGTGVVVQVKHPYQLKNQMPPVAVLTSQSTGSAGEATAISFRGRPDTHSFGTPTYGVPNSPTVITLSDGATLWVAYALWADRTGHIYRYNEHLQPDEFVRTLSPEDKLIGTDKDPVLQAGLRWVQSQPPCAR
jgi:C-terminal processing protease CtpA/Prc